MGDGFENCILGLIASLLPKDNIISQKLNETTKSNYFYQKNIKLGHERFRKMRVYSIPTCRKGCLIFTGDHQSDKFCLVCGNDNQNQFNQTIYYFPIRDRLNSLLRSDIRKFFHYPAMRPTTIQGYVEDVYDGSTWKSFLALMKLGVVFIGLNFCWDGADMFEFSGKSIWPLSITILNFPKDLRDKLNIGFHVIATCSGKVII